MAEATKVPHSEEPVQDGYLVEHGATRFLVDNTGMIYRFYCRLLNGWTSEEHYGTKNIAEFLGMPIDQIPLKSADQAD
jgi:cytochrome oxidase Cu insertion factor (SCO1/SenC/PrrC family)